VQLADYIYLKFYKKAKRQTPEKGFALFENDITTFEPVSKIKIHSRYSNQKRQSQVTLPS
jgi:hypothetical protein